jgi:hypothetical protein
MGHFDKQGTEDIEKLCKINCSAPAALMSLCIPLKSCVYDIFYSDGKDGRA